MEITPKTALAAFAALVLIAAAGNFYYGKITEFKKAGADGKEFLLGATAGIGLAAVVTILFSAGENVALATKTTLALSAIIVILLALLKFY